jgi:hypothetical protein
MPDPSLSCWGGAFYFEVEIWGTFHDVTSTLDLPKRSYDTVWQLTPGTSFHPEAIFSKR